MTQNQSEISRVRNLEKIQMGMHEMEPWYFSPYPAEFASAETVYIDPFCLGYFDNKTQFYRHRAKCQLQHPPGNEIYRDDSVSFFEIDGRRQRTWCRNLCLLSKLFLDHKTVYYDVDPFLFYCMTVQDNYGHHLVGYFSKEKESAEGFNVACILTLPQYQRKGYGRLLIQFSYELSKIEGKLGSPEKPLSDLGLLGYRAYWQEVIVDLVMQNLANGNSISIEELGLSLAMTTTDVTNTLQLLNMLRYHVIPPQPLQKPKPKPKPPVPHNPYKRIYTNTPSSSAPQHKEHVLVLPKAVKAAHQAQVEKQKTKPKREIDPVRLKDWKPPVFSASARTWNW